MTDLTVSEAVFTLLAGLSAVLFVLMALAAFLPVDWALPSIITGAP